MRPLLNEFIPDCILELLSDRQDLLYEETNNNHALPHFNEFPYVSIGNDTDITSLAVYEITSAGDVLKWAVFSKHSTTEDGVTYYRAQTDYSYDPGVYYYLINGSTYTQAFRICKPEWKIKFWHEDSLEFGYMWNDPDEYADEISFFTNEIRQKFSEKKTVAIKKNGIEHIAESYRHRRLIIDAFVPYFVMERLNDLEYMSNREIHLLNAGGTYDVHEIEYIKIVPQEGVNIYRVEVDIVTSDNIKHYTYQKGKSLGSGGVTAPGVIVTNSAGVLTATPSGGSGNYTIQWYADGEPVATGTSYDTGGAGGDYVAVVIDDDTSLIGQDEHSIANLCENYNVGFEITNVVGSNNKLITLTANGLAPHTYVWKSSADNITFSTESETSNIFEVTSSGYYQYIVTDSNSCQKINTVYVEIATHTVTISRSGDTLTAVVASCGGTPTYQWYEDTGAGETILSGETGETLDVDSNANYIVKVNCGGNIVEANRVVVDIGGDTFMVNIEKVWMDSGSQKAQAAVINPPTATIQINWYQIIAGVYVQIGSGTSVVLTQDGYIRCDAIDENGQKVSDYMAFEVVNPTSYNKFVISASLENEFTVSGFTLPNPATATANDIAAAIQVKRNGVELTYSSSAAASLDRNEFGIDYSTNKIYISSALTRYENEIVEILNL